MKKLMHYFKGFTPMVVFAPIFKLIEAVFELLTPLFVARIIDAGIANHDVTYILINGGYLVLFAVLGFGFSMCCQYLASRAGQGFATAIRRDLFHHVNGFSFAQLDVVSPSSLTARITGDVNTLQQGVSMCLRLLTRSPFIIIGATVSAIIMSPVISSIFFAVAIVIAVVAYFIMSRSSPYYRQAAAQSDRVAERAKESLSGARVIRAYAKQEDETERAHREINALAKINLRVNKIASLLNPASMLVVNLGILAIIGFGGIMVGGGGLTAGKIIALINYMTQIQLSLLVLANLIVNITRAGAAITRINEVLDTPIAEDAATTETLSPDASIAVSFEDVTFGYHEGSEPAVEHVSGFVKSGGCLGLIGGTGSGKSTLVNLIHKFYEVDSGEIRLFGKKMSEYTQTELTQLIGFVPQKPVLFSGTVRDNLKWRNELATDDELYAALDAAQAREFIDELPDGLNHYVAQNGRNFSGGQRQRLTIARALVDSPKILVLDDSTSALDAETDAKLRAAVSRLDMTVLLISQRAGSLMKCDSIIVLDQGDQVGYGTHDELLKGCPLYREIYESQIRFKGGRA